MNPRLNVTNVVDEKRGRYKYHMSEALQTLNDITLLKFYQDLYDAMIKYDLTIMETCPKEFLPTLEKYNCTFCVESETDEYDDGKEHTYEVYYFQFETFKSHKIPYEIHPKNLMRYADLLSRR